MICTDLSLLARFHDLPSLIFHFLQLLSEVRHQLLILLQLALQMSHTLLTLFQVAMKKKQRETLQEAETRGCVQAQHALGRTSK